MIKDQGDELCPVSSFEKYISKIPKETKAFYLHLKRGEKLGDVWHSLEPMGVITWVQCYRVYPKRQEHQFFTQITALEARPSRKWLRVDWRPEK